MIRCRGNHFWELIEHIRAERTGMSVIVATSIMDEAQKFDWLVAMDAGQVMATGSPEELLAHTALQNAGCGLHRTAAGSVATRPPRRDDSADG